MPAVSSSDSPLREFRSSPPSSPLSSTGQVGLFGPPHAWREPISAATPTAASNAAAVAFQAGAKRLWSAVVAGDASADNVCRPQRPKVSHSFDVQDQDGGWSPARTAAQPDRRCVPPGRPYVNRTLASVFGHTLGAEQLPQREDVVCEGGGTSDGPARDSLCCNLLSRFLTLTKRDPCPQSRLAGEADQAARQVPGPPTTARLLDQLRRRPPTDARKPDTDPDNPFYISP